MDKRYTLGLVIKRAILGTDDIRRYAGYIAELANVGFPLCNIFGLRSGQACGFISCPHCEFARRMTFAEVTIEALAANDGKLWFEQTRYYGKELADLHTFFTEAERKKIFRVNGFVAWRRCAGFDMATQQWVFDCFAIYAAPPPKRYTTDGRSKSFVTTPEDYPPSAEPSMLEHFGTASGFVAAIATAGLSPLGAANSPDDVAATREAWRASKHRIRLIGLAETKKKRDARLRRKKV